MDGMKNAPTGGRREPKSWFGIVQDGNLEAFRSFVEHGGNYLAKCSDHAALFLACIEGHTDVAKFITTLPGVDVHEKCKGVDPFYAACHSGNVDLVQFMLSLNVYNINIRQKEGCTPFFEASSNNHLPVVKLLLENGADVDIPDEGGNSPLLSSIANGKIELFLMLLKHGARPTREALEFAKQLGRSQMRKILEKKLDTKVPKGLVKICCQCFSTPSTKMKICAGCQNASYCNQECQKMDWPKHKLLCRPPSTRTSVEVSADEVARAAAAEAELLQMLDDEEEEASAKKKNTAGKSTKKKK